VSELKRRLGDSFSLLHAVSICYQRGEATAEEYYELGLDILAGDGASLLRLVNKLPDAGKREAVQRCHEAAVAELEGCAANCARGAHLCLHPQRRRRGLEDRLLQVGGSGLRVRA
jgi:hypothetical protein